MKNKKTFRPTESELEILQVLWNTAPATVRQVHEAMEHNRDTGYTTTLKTMQIMAGKGILSRDTSSRTHLYTPLVSREECQQDILGKMMNGLFKGSAARLVMGALDSERLSGEDLQEIREFLEKFDDKKP